MNWPVTVRFQNGIDEPTVEPVFEWGEGVACWLNLPWYTRPASTFMVIGPYATRLSPRRVSVAAVVKVKYDDKTQACTGTVVQSWWFFNPRPTTWEDISTHDKLDIMRDFYTMALCGEVPWEEDMHALVALEAL